jgi:hypothetical protein
MRRNVRGIAMLEAIVSLAIFVSLVGSVAYASRLALSVMTESMAETRLLYRVRRALDHAEEQLSRVSRVSIVALTENGWTLAGIENWFEQQAVFNAGTPLGDGAAEIFDDLTDTRDKLVQGPADYVGAESKLDRAIAGLDELVGGGLVSVADGIELREALDTLRNQVRARSVTSIGGLGTGIANAWLEIEEIIASAKSLVAAEPLVESDQVLFRQLVLGPGGAEYRPPLGEPPCSYYIRPMSDGQRRELVFYDGTRTSVIASDIVNITFQRFDRLLRITLRYREERDGAMIERTEVRSVVLHVP